MSLITRRCECVSDSKGGVHESLIAKKVIIIMSLIARRCEWVIDSKEGNNNNVINSKEV